MQLNATEILVDARPRGSFSGTVTVDCPTDQCITLSAESARCLAGEQTATFRFREFTTCGTASLSVGCSPGIARASMLIKPSFRSRPTWATARSAIPTGISRALASSSAWLAPGSSASLCPDGRHESCRPPTRGTAWPGPTALLLRLLDQPAAAQRLHDRGIQGHVQAALGFPREEAGSQARRSSRAEHRRR